LSDLAELSFSSDAPSATVAAAVAAAVAGAAVQTDLSLAGVWLTDERM